MAGRGRGRDGARRQHELTLLVEVCGGTIGPVAREAGFVFRPDATQAGDQDHAVLYEAGADEFTRRFPAADLGGEQGCVDLWVYWQPRDGTLRVHVADLDHPAAHPGLEGVTDEATLRTALAEVAVAMHGWLERVARPVPPAPTAMPDRAPPEPAGPVTRDGSPVDVYLALPWEPSFGSIVDAIPDGASVLDLGCGVGRLANVLAARGHDVVGVDESREMLAHLDPRVHAVAGRIQDLELDRSFDVVVLASHLVNVTDVWDRVGLLATAREHCAPGGTVLIQHHAPAQFDDHHEVRVGDVDVGLRVHGWRGDVVSATVTYTLTDGRSWAQTFAAQVLDDDALDTVLSANGLRRTARLADDWVAATPA